MRRVAALAALAAVAVATLAACGGGDDSTDAAREPDARRDAVIERADIGSVALTEPAEDGAGKIPTFAWESVPGATDYRLFVLNADGAPIWAWQGTETSAVLGGNPHRSDGDAGPVITAGATWSVAALDADGAVIALSADRPVSP
jgi:hypothetical protein